jgi:hypothetical protein
MPTTTDVPGIIRHHSRIGRGNIHDSRLLDESAAAHGAGPRPDGEAAMRQALFLDDAFYAKKRRKCIVVPWKHWSTRTKAATPHTCSTSLSPEQKRFDARVERAGIMVQGANGAMECSERVFGPWRLPSPRVQDPDAHAESGLLPSWLNLVTTAALTGPASPRGSWSSPRVGLLFAVQPWSCGGAGDEGIVTYMCVCICEAFGLSEFHRFHRRHSNSPIFKNSPFSLIFIHIHSSLNHFFGWKSLENALVIYSLIPFDSMIVPLMGSRQTGDIGGDVESFSVK